MASDDQDTLHVAPFQKEREDEPKGKSDTRSRKSDGLKGNPALLASLIVATVLLISINIFAPFGGNAPITVTDDDAHKALLATPASPPSPRATQNASPAPEGALISVQREKALKALEQLNAQWTVLEAMSPSLWSKDAYSAARDLYSSGDEAYAADDFVRAALIYEQGLDATHQMIEASQGVFKEAIQKGGLDLQQRAYGGAEESFNIALAIAPDHPEAATGLNSAQNGAAVDRLMVKASFYKDANQFSEAGTVLKEALKLDPTRLDAKQLLNELGRDEGEYRLDRLISKANESLSAQRFDDAINLFDQALKMSPAHKDALAGKALALSEKKSYSLATYRVDGIRAEAQENWPNAIAAYNAALALDNKAHFAAEGLKRTTHLKALSDEMAIYLTKPKRVSSPAVFSAANALFVQIAGMDNAPSGLKSQNSALGEILDAMQAPVPVRVLSDNKSLVSIQKIGELGLLKDKTINLRAGRYVFIAKRTGYADKRVVIDIPADATSMLLKVICDEKI